MRVMMQDLVNGLESFRVSSSCETVVEARLLLTRKRPSVVLLDEVLPGESAIDFLEVLAREGLPVVLISGMETTTHALPPGAHCRIQKPDWRSLDQDAQRIEQALLRALRASDTKK